ncbi:hypothetical protein J5N97_010846 [Dioscorea zingiberensis]|uniref:Chlororespiratory reduction 42 n=1 Tax=Dioscorea zingiberensis TaxID=325984 RepID=A0A9D5HN60_9LILI|nr:hypothetical protein J5N97_010846 [Dioscorea zingiberensis]
MPVHLGATTILSPKLQWSPLHKQSRALSLVTRCESSSGDIKLQIGSPVIIVEAPPTLKTAASMPSLRVNSGEVKAGDVGRIVARKPKDVWAVRLAIGTYLMDGKHFKPLDVHE